MTRLTWIVNDKLLTEQHSIMVLSAILKREGINTTLLYTNRLSGIINGLKQLKPDIVAYSLMFGSHRNYIPISKMVRSEFPQIIQVAGGPYTTYYPEAIDELSLDAICIGEGDLTLPKYMKSRFDKSFISVDGFHIRNNGEVEKYPVPNLINDLDSLPFPDRELFYSQDSFLRNQEFKSFLSGRGCPYLCNYCFNHKFNEIYKGKGNIIRKKSVDYFIEEINEIKMRYGIQYLIFEDDVFIIKKDWFHEFAGKYKKKIDLPYICYVQPKLVDKEIVKLLKESGCHIVRMAIETGNEELRTKVLNRNVKNAEIIKAADIIHSAGLKLSVSNMIGLPMETLANVYETVDLNIRCAPEHPSAQFFMPYPGMELTKIAIKAGYFSEDMFSQLEKNTWKSTPLKFNLVTKLEMEKIQKIFPLVVRYPVLKRYLRLVFKFPLKLLYYISMFIKIFIVVGYFPRTKISFVQRIRVFFRFFSFYG